MPHVDLILDGKRVPSVTEILGAKSKPWLEAWRTKWGILAERKTACANAIGTAFHSGAERLSRGEDVVRPSNRRLGKMLERIDAWFVSEGFKLVEAELHVISRKHWYHGTFDAIGTLKRFGSAIVLIDYKTSSAIYPDMAEQLAAYAEALYEDVGTRVKIGLIVHVSKDKPHHKITVKEYKLGKRLLNKFLKKLRQYNEAKA